MAADAAMAGVPHAMIPTPRQISASCGMALRFEAPDDEAARSAGAGHDDAAALRSLYREVPSADGAAKNARYIAL